MVWGLGPWLSVSEACHHGVCSVGSIIQTEKTHNTFILHMRKEKARESRNGT